MTSTTCVRLAHHTMVTPPNPTDDQPVPEWLLDRLAEVAPLVADLRAQMRAATDPMEAAEFLRRAEVLEADLGRSLLYCHTGAAQ